MAIVLACMKKSLQLTTSIDTETGKPQRKRRNGREGHDFLDFDWPRISQSASTAVK